MVFLTLANLGRHLVAKISKVGGRVADHRGPDKFWKVQQYLRWSYHFRGRKRNCFRIGMRYVHKALQYSTQNRRVNRKNLKDIWDTRLDAAVQEHGLKNGHHFREGLARCNIQLDRKVLQDLAIYEPRSFQSLAEISRTRLEEENLLDVDAKKIKEYEGIHHRSMRLE